jgi:hypothetical protein
VVNDPYRGADFLFVQAFLSGTRPRGWKHACGFIQRRLATLELALVVAHGLDRFRVGAGERFAATHVAQLVEHDGPGCVSALMGLDRGQLHLLAAAAGAPAEAGGRVALAVSKAVGNAVVHAYIGAAEPGPVELEVHVTTASS